NTDIEENQLGITIDAFGNMAQVFQVYEVIYDDQQGDAGREVGMMCYMLASKDNRWHIANVLWEAETEENKIGPEFYDEPLDEIAGN
ncbi:MAG: hypothetical protein IH948_09705, partial [Bacteroidetes bacterium]|nr:hypothetical protein [Bacteroidota bacterium]